MWSYSFLLNPTLIALDPTLIPLDPTLILHDPTLILHDPTWSYVILTWFCSQVSVTRLAWRCTYQSVYSYYFPDLWGQLAPPCPWISQIPNVLQVILHWSPSILCDPTRSYTDLAWSYCNPTHSCLILHDPTQSYLILLWSYTDPTAILLIPAQSYTDPGIILPWVVVTTCPSLGVCDHELEGAVA